MYKNNSLIINSLILTSGLLFNACGGSDSITSSVKKGYLIDSAIQGVQYTTNSMSGTTDDLGTFKYEKSDTSISFKVGSLTLADFNLSKLNSDKKLLPNDIFGIDRNNTDNQDVLKFLRVVQSLDNDSNASNGILIDDNTKNELIQDINIKDINITQIQTIMNNISKTLISKSDALSHFRSTLKTMDIKDISIIEHNGILYDIVVSPFTSRIWIDRNVGADKICTALNDSACYGDYYQWGRNTDGHQASNYSTTRILASDINASNLNGDFVSRIESDNNLDWIEQSIDYNGTKRSNAWSKIDGSSICPVGFRVPTKDELDNETINITSSDKVTTNAEAFTNFLKIPSAGYISMAGIKGAQGEYGILWSSSTNENKSSRHNFFDTVALTFYGAGRSHGFSVRCIKN